MRAVKCTMCGADLDVSEGARYVVCEYCNSTIDLAALDGDGGDTATASTMLERAYLCLEDGLWGKAAELLEEVLNASPRNARAYVGKLMVHRKARKEEDLAWSEIPLSAYPEYKRALSFASLSYRATLEGYNAAILTRLGEAKKEKRYTAAMDAKRNADRSDEFLHAALLFDALQDYKDSPQQAKLCRDCAEQRKKREQEQAEKEEQERAELAAAQEQADLLRRRQNRIALLVVAAILALCLLFAVVIPAASDAVSHQKAENNKQMYYESGEQACSEMDYAFAAEQFQKAGIYKDATTRALECHYRNGKQLLADGDYEGAKAAFEKAGSHEDAEEYLPECNYGIGVACFEAGDYQKAVKAFQMTGAYRDAKKWYDKSNYHYAIELYEAGHYSEAADIFQTLSDYEDAGSYLQKCTDDLENREYERAEELLSEGETDEAMFLFGSIIPYKDSAVRYLELYQSGPQKQGRIAVSNGDVFAVGEDGDLLTTSSYLERFVNWTDLVSICVDSSYIDVLYGLRKDGTVLAVGTDLIQEHLKYAHLVKEWTGITKLIWPDYGDYGMAGLRSDGTVVFAGRDKRSQKIVSEWKEITDVVIANEYIAGLKQDGTIVICGEMEEPFVSDPREWTDVAAIFTNTVGGLDAIKTDGTTLSSWSKGIESYVVNYGGGLNGGSSMSRGYYGLFRLYPDGTLENTKMEIPWEHIVDCVEENGKMVGLHADGTVVMWSSDDMEEVILGDLW